MQIRFRSFISLRHSVSLAASVGSVGHERGTSKAYDWDGMKRGGTPLSLFQYTLSGEGVLIREGVREHIRLGQAILLNIPGRHRYFLPDHSDHWEFFYVCLTGTEIRRLWQTIEDKCSGIFAFPESHPCIQSLRELVALAESPTAPTVYELSSRSYALAMQLADSILPGPESRQAVPGAIAKAKELADTQYGSGVEVADLAKEAGMSRFHFTRQFSKYFGEKPSRYLLRTRITEAVRRLRDPKLSVKEIAYECGFKDPSHFSRVFREETGSTPRDFRRSGLL